MDNTQNNFDSNTVSWIARPADEAWAQMESLVGDERYSAQYKQEQVTTHFSAALCTTDERYQETLPDIEKKIADLEAAVSYQPVLTSEVDIQKLTYTRDSLQQQWVYMKIHELQADWKAALDRGDTITAKVYRDFSRPHFQGDFPVTVTPPGYAELAAQTDEMLSTPEQKQAKKDLLYWNNTLLEVHKAHGAAKSRLRNPRLTSDGLSDGVREDYMCRLRSR